MRNVLYKSLLVLALVPALGQACDYGDCGYSSYDYGASYDYSSSYDYSYDYSYDTSWSGAYNTGGASMYQSMYDLYQTTYDVDITTTSYVPIYGSDMGYGGGCSSVIIPCGGGYESPNLWDTPYGMGQPTIPNLGVIPRDPNQPLPLDPFNPYANIPLTPPLGNMIPRDPNTPFFPPVPPVVPPGVNPFQPPVAMFPPMNPFPINTWPMNPTPPTYPPTNPNPSPVTPTPVTPGTPPSGSNVPRDPRNPYNPPTPPTFGGCDGVIVACPTGPVTRPSPQIGGTPPTNGNVPINRTVPTTPNPVGPTTPVYNSPTHNSPGSAPQRNEVPRGARAWLRR